MNKEINQQGIIEAILFTVGEPVSCDKIASILGIDNKKTKHLLYQMQEQFNNDETRALQIREVAGGFQLATKSQFSVYLTELAQQESKTMSLSQASLETLAIIAYRQPVTKVEIEAIRGVRADKAVSNLLERGLIEEAGRKETIGRPILYITTPLFLQSFGLNSLDGLPDKNNYIEDLKRADTGSQLELPNTEV